MAEGAWSPERDAKVVAPAPQLAEEQRLQRPWIAKVNAAQQRIGDDAESGVGDAVAEVHVFARGEAGVEAADPLKDRSLHGEVAAAKPGRVFAARRLHAQAIVMLLYPIRAGRRQ